VATNVKETEEAKIINDHLDGPNEAWNGVCHGQHPCTSRDVPTAYKARK